MKTTSARISRSLSQFPSIAVVLFVALLAGPAWAQAAQGQAKVAVIDVQRILLDSKRGQEVQKTLEEAQNAKRDEFAAKAQVLEGLRKEFSEKALTLAEDRLQDLQKQIEDKTLELQRMQDDVGRELKTLSDERLGEIEKEVMPIIEQIGKEGGYTLVFNKFQSGLVFADEAVDITQSVIERYDSKSN